ncbi:hypothetical protein E4T38_08257 [Aureobasidium subglaciale]|nr:hypothetical protein E4T38_08257 [Aureobasidium subglaciale]KAI5215674.1 hypothetical protein E4T40_08267 [Aureobasidium subglaciale]KAI5218883.1 hypothetical protein E4T41_08182 [Aureobasidium subglaciale]KAI5256510.1 hypothetical protein E4T46_08158 [Aureobasidium subglaciale]
MAPNITLQRAHSPSSARRRQFLLPAILRHIQETRNESNMITNFINNSASMSSSLDLSDLSDALDSPVSSDKHRKPANTRGVRFNSKIQAHRVSFSDEVVDIETAESALPSPSSSPPRKRVRFGCLKKNVRKHFSHTPIYKMKIFDAISPLMTSKKRVRFGCMKGEVPTITHMHDEVNELLADESATFKREKRRGSTSTDDDEMSEMASSSEGPGLD